MQTTDHLFFMNEALTLAEKGRRTVSPNPMVGCVIVKENAIVGRGYHQKAGSAHAEVNALHEAGEKARGAAVYVTLEPCCHKGKTDPCVNALITAGVSKVIVATIDPNPIVCGRGVKRLRDAGIEVEIGLCGEKAQALNEIFFHYIKHEKPFVIAKWAMSLDGKTITHPNDSRIISNEASHQHAHDIREQVDGILVGANTIRMDNPSLTARNHDDAKQPARIIIINQGDLPLNANIFLEPQNKRTIVAAPRDISEKLKTNLMSKNIDLILLSRDNNQQINLDELLRELGKKQITSLLVEGGATTHTHFFTQGLVNRVQVYLAPVIISDLNKKQVVQQMKVTPLANDWYLTGEIDV